MFDLFLIFSNFYFKIWEIWTWESFWEFWDTVFSSLSQTSFLIRIMTWSFRCYYESFLFKWWRSKITPTEFLRISTWNSWQLRILKRNFWSFLRQNFSFRWTFVYLWLNKCIDKIFFNAFNVNCFTTRIIKIYHIFRVKSSNIKVII